MTAHPTIKAGFEFGGHSSQIRMFEEWQYLQRRCDQERTKASFCANDLMADVHRELARLYQARAERLAGEGRQIAVASTAGVGEETAQSKNGFSRNIIQSSGGF